MDRHYQINEVARMSGVTTRTLRHYDEMGLLSPSLRSASGYRLYSKTDLLRLQQILIARNLGMALSDIQCLLDDPAIDRRELLIKQRQELVARADLAAAMIRSVDIALRLLPNTNTQELPKMDVSDLFTGINPYEDEARERWGKSDAYQESAARTRKYGPVDWRIIGEEWQSIIAHVACAMKSGVAQDSAEAMDIAERYRSWLNRWFFACSPAMHGAMAAMFEADPRFARTVDRHEEGLSLFWAAAIRSNAIRQSRPSSSNEV